MDYHSLSVSYISALFAFFSLRSLREIKKRTLRSLPEILLKKLAAPQKEP